MNTRRNWILLTLFTVFAYFAIQWIAERQEKKKTIFEPQVDVDLSQIQKRGVLRVIMEYNSISYFIYKGQKLGFEYELMQNYAKKIGVKLEIVIANTYEDQYNLLNEGRGDIIANAILSSKKVKQQAELTKPYRSIEQVIVQRKPNNIINPADSSIQTKDTLIHSALELSDKVIYVAENSIYYNQLKEISDSFGINIDVRVLGDGRGTDDILEAIGNGEIGYTIANKDIAMLNQSYYQNLDISIPVGKPQNLYWAVRKNSTNLLLNINNFIIGLKRDSTLVSLYNKYFSDQKYINYGFDESATMEQGLISNYDAIIQQYSKSINWDWRLVAAVIHQESRFNPNARSWCGAQGLMQLMPGTARQMGCYSNEVYNPAINIRLGTSYLKDIEKTWASVSNFTQRVKFILASYNAGPGHVADAVRLAEKYGYPKDKWDGSVEYFMLYKSNPRFYNDPVVKYGYCRGQEPFNYVRNIVNKYFEYQTKISSIQPNGFRFEQISPQGFEGIDGIYNPMQGLIARSAKRELFLSHKLFNENNNLIVRERNKHLFKKSNTELFAGAQDSSSQLFQERSTVFQNSTLQPNRQIEPNPIYKINKLKPRKKSQKISRD